MSLVTLEAGSHEEETELVKEKQEVAQDTLRKTDKKSLWTYGENKPGLLQLVYIICRSLKKMHRKLCCLSKFNYIYN